MSRSDSTTCWTLPATVYDAMTARAEADYPEETCGLIFAAAETAESPGSLAVVPMDNIQNAMHARDPENFPRDASTAYYFDPGEFARVLREREGRGEVMRAIYHSHPDHDAYFSEKDRNDAAPPDLGGPLFPDCVYIVFSVRQGHVTDVKGFSWSDAAEDFVDVTITRGS